MHAGHYIAKGACGLIYYFHEKNVHAQCFRCNMNLEGNRVDYRLKIIEVYGRKTLKDLETNYHQPSHNYPFEEKIEEYKEKLRLIDDVPL